MFKSFLSTMKGLGRKALGFIRGLNGDKAATFASSALSKWIHPAVGSVATPFLKQLGQYANEKLDEWSKDDRLATEGGIRKPTGRRPRFRSPAFASPPGDEAIGSNTYKEIFS